MDDARESLFARSSRAHMRFCSSDDKDAIRFESFRNTKYSSRDIGLRFRVSRYDLTCVVVIAFKEVSVEFAVELGLVFLSNRPDEIPELLPALPLPALGFGRKILSVVV